MNMAFALIIFLPVIMGCSEKQDATSTAFVSTTKEQAVAVILELPEIKAWSNYIECTTEGMVHASIMVFPEEPETLDEKQYWSVNFYEAQATHAHRWESFLVSLDSKKIMVDDMVDGIISLEEWRHEKKPMERVPGGQCL